ncbi:FlgB family protein [Yoonia sediminilitoris]|uniref:Flagellar basal-body rod protein FlgB n=1 Tax=Yoonia sediminilitoris TaxID=1286148 RepID=A0A2T6KAD1_9RHOB|nr:FlgB family protein [Yoonia sediminilitoris]PUB11783.1 flagellar basal-body rod protein FlgB [Yoonia sediminilitoris]RCW91860.1 flagellar basal-body rod protein FlgB [Yoonia sediminilitoris]
MYNSLDLFQTAAAMARHAGSRQAVVARNIAHADTPGYAAQHIPAFQDVYKDGEPNQMRATRAGHVRGGAQAATGAVLTTTNSEASPNGNTVSLEEELLNSVAVSREHNRALAIYKHGMTILRNSLGRS